MSSSLKTLIAVLLCAVATAFVPGFESVSQSTTKLSVATISNDDGAKNTSRRTFFNTVASSGVAAAVFGSSLPAWSADNDDLEASLYKIVRVREATQQERRLIKTGKFKDIQRANVKLAVKFMVQNYQLGDSCIAASAYLKGGNQMKAIDVGQTAVQNLQTILEYFDTSDVQNIKVGSDSMAGKEALVLKGLEAASFKLDEFLGFFPEDVINKVKDKVKAENDLNVKEFDPSLGDIINLAPV